MPIYRTEKNKDYDCGYVKSETRFVWDGLTSVLYFWDRIWYNEANKQIICSINRKLFHKGANENALCYWHYIFDCFNNMEYVILHKKQTENKERYCLFRSCYCLQFYRHNIVDTTNVSMMI